MVQTIVKPQRLQQVNQVAGVGTRTQPKRKSPTSVGFFLSYSMTFEEASDMFAMYSISPQLTCQCDEFHMCQQCYEDEKNESELNGLENRTFEGD